MIIQEIDKGKPFDWGKTSDDYAKYRDIYPQEFYNYILNRGLCKDGQKVLDIGTGSGCIACTIAKKTSATVLGVDISSDALRIALDNVTRLGINNRAVFRKSDLFSKIRAEERFDMIISNPPYIPKGTELEPELRHEPSIALFAEENGLQLYRKIVSEAPDYLNEGGWLIFELGIGESDAVKSFMDEYFEGVTVEKDLNGIDRIIYGKMI